LRFSLSVDRFSGEVGHRETGINAARFADRRIRRSKEIYYRTRPDTSGAPAAATRLDGHCWTAHKAARKWEFASKTGQFNYSGLLGGLAAGSIANLYSPSAERGGVNTMFENTAIGIGSSALSNLLQEFVIRRFSRLAKQKP
jgi:hypothetical protein